MYFDGSRDQFTVLHGFCHGSREANIESGIISDELVLLSFAPSGRTFIWTWGLDIQRHLGRRCNHHTNVSQHPQLSRALRWSDELHETVWQLRTVSWPKPVGNGLSATAFETPTLLELR